MRIQGPFTTQLPTAPRRKVGKAKNVAEQASQEEPRVLHFDPKVDYQAAGEYLDLDPEKLSPNARKALQGYWLITQQSWNRQQYVDIYV